MAINIGGLQTFPDNLYNSITHFIITHIFICGCRTIIFVCLLHAVIQILSRLHITYANGLQVAGATKIKNLRNEVETWQQRKITADHQI